MKHHVKEILIFSISILLSLPIASAFSADTKIEMARTKLESPTGMKIYEYARLKVDQAVVRKLTAEQGLNTKPMTLRSTKLGNLNVFMERESKFNRLIANQTRGHLYLLPNMEKMAKTRTKLLPERSAYSKALSYVDRLKLVPADVSRFAPKKLVTLSAAEMKQDGKAGETRDVLQTVLFARTVDNRPVIGKGAQLHVDLGGDGQLAGFGRTWNRMVASRTKPLFRDDKGVYGEIEKIIMEQFPKDMTVKVQTPRLVYAGNDGKFVQPAYRFEAVVKGPNATGEIYYDGVVTALRNSPEPVRRVIDPRKRVMPETVTAEMEKTAPVQLAQAVDDPLICRYVVRDDSGDWVDDANDFKNGLLSGWHTGLPALSFPQYYWDYPWLWTTSEASFVDRCHVALMEGHGNHWLFTTRSNCCDTVSLNAGTQPGYGNRAGDSMRYLILKGCSIVPAPPDRSNWADPWWRIFKGLRQAVGFRTTMYINDNISDDFGYWIGKNCRVLDSWFYATNTNSSYGWNRFWGAHVTGYGAVVMIPGQEGAGIYHTSAVPPATTAGLTIWWQH